MLMRSLLFLFLALWYFFLRLLPSSPDGSAYGLGDVIGVRVDLRACSIEFFKNGVAQGVAFTNVDPALGPFYPAISMHAVRATVKFIPH